MLPFLSQNFKEQSQIVPGNDPLTLRCRTMNEIYDLARECCGYDKDLYLPDPRLQLSQSNSASRAGPSGKDGPAPTPNNGASTSNSTQNQNRPYWKANRVLLVNPSSSSADNISFSPPKLHLILRTSLKSLALFRLVVLVLMFIPSASRTRNLTSPRLECLLVTPLLRPPLNDSFGRSP